MHTIDSLFSAFDPDGQYTVGQAASHLSCISCRGLDFIPDLKKYIVSCDRARIEARVETLQTAATDQLGGAPACRVYTLQVFALRDRQRLSHGDDALVRYQLNVDPDSELGLTLGNILAPHVGVSPHTAVSSNGGVESLLHEIDNLVLDNPTAKWSVLPTNDLECITEDELERISLDIENASVLRVAPSFHEFVTNPLSTCSKFVSTKSTTLRHFTLINTLHPRGEMSQLELLTQDTSGKVLHREHFTARIRNEDPDAWLLKVKDRVHNVESEASNAIDEKQASKELLALMVDSAAVFKSIGPGGIRSMFGYSPDKQPAKGVVSGDINAMSERDKEILKGEINLEMNQLSDGFDEARSFEHSFDAAPATPASLVLLEIGDCVARVSVHARRGHEGSTDGSATIAWYLRNKTPFSTGDTAALERMWKAAEMLQRNSEGSIYEGLEALSRIAIPKCRGMGDLQAVLDFDLDSIRGVDLTPVTPILLGQMARVVEGIEEIDAAVLAPQLAVTYPGNFQKMRFSLHNDGALSIQAVNSLKGRLSAFIPASGFEEMRRSRSEAIELLCKLLVWRPEGARQHIQGAIKSLADRTDGWYASTANHIDTLGLAHDIPPIDAVQGNLAYDHAIRIAKNFARIAKVDVASIPLALLAKDSLYPHASSVILTEEASRSQLLIVVDEIGIKTATLRFRTQDRNRRISSITFARPSGSESPFGTREQLQQLITDFYQLGDDVRQRRRETNHHTNRAKEHPLKPRRKNGKPPSPETSKSFVDVSRVVSRLSDQMKQIRGS